VCGRSFVNILAASLLECLSRSRTANFLRRTNKEREREKKLLWNVSCRAAAGLWQPAWCKEYYCRHLCRCRGHRLRYLNHRVAEELLIMLIFMEVCQLGYHWAHQVLYPRTFLAAVKTGCCFP
jgi:hypothetical protein